MMKFCVFCVDRLLIVFIIFLLDGVLIFMSVKFFCFVVILVNFYLFWNYGFLGCFIRKLILIGLVVCVIGLFIIIVVVVVSVMNVLCFIFSVFLFLLNRM